MLLPERLRWWLEDHGLIREPYDDDWERWSWRDRIRARWVGLTGVVRMHDGTPGVGVMATPCQYPVSVIEMPRWARFIYRMHRRTICGRFPNAVHWSHTYRVRYEYVERVDGHYEGPSIGDLTYAAVTEQRMADEIAALEAKRDAIWASLTSEEAS